MVNEMAEHNEEIRLAVQMKTELVNSYITAVVIEGQESGEIKPEVEATNLVAFMEDAGRGAMVSMKELDSSYPIDNFIKMIRTLILN